MYVLNLKTKSRTSETGSWLHAPCPTPPPQGDSGSVVPAFTLYDPRTEKKRWYLENYSGICMTRMYGHNSKISRDNEAVTFSRQEIFKSFLWLRVLCLRYNYLHKSTTVVMLFPDIISRSRDNTQHVHPSISSAKVTNIIQWVRLVICVVVTS